MQLFAASADADVLSNRRRGGSGSADNHLARRQFARVGGDPLCFLLPRPVHEGFRADPLNRLNRESKRDAAGRSVRNHEVLGPDADLARFIEQPPFAGKLRVDLL